MRNPLAKVFDFRKQELPVVALLFSFFFLVIAVFQMLYALKRGLFLEHYGADVELYAKLLNIVVAALAVVGFTALRNRLQRQRLIYALCAFFIFWFVVLTQALADPSTLAVWGFYLLVDLETTLMVATFWAYATDISTSDQAKRLFGVIGAGGIVGGLAGSALTASLPEGSATTQGLLWVAAVMMAVITVVIYRMETLMGGSGVFRKVMSPGPAEHQSPSKMNAAFQGAKLVMRSPYLAAIVGIMACYEIASQTMDYQFSVMAESVAGVTETQGFIADIRFYANLLSVFVQFFLVSLIMRKLGVVAALLVLPLAAVGSSAAFLVVATLPAAGLLHITDNGLNYSIQQTARESLYVVTTQDEKYKARAFTNMFIQRFAKGVSILALLGLIAIQVDIRYVSLITIAVMVVMILCSVYAGRRFELKSAESGPPTRGRARAVAETGKGDCTNVQTAAPVLPPR